jgi:hypothetical protein
MKFDGVTSDAGGVGMEVHREPQPWGRMEYAYSLMARDAGIEMAECHLLREGELAHFMTRRFDRLGPDPLHVHTLAGFLHVDFNDQYTLSYEQYFDAIRMLVESGIVVICAGGGGIPTAYDEEGKLYGVEAVIDKDLAAGLLARGLGADCFIMLTDVDGVYADYGGPRERLIREAHPEALESLSFAEGSMGPKVAGACRFVRQTGGWSAVGRLSDLERIFDGQAGTLISGSAQGIRFD